MWMRRLAAALAVLMALLVAGGVGVWRSAQPPDIPDFYDSAAVPDGAQAGQVLGVEGIDSPVAGARIWRMRYTSINLAGAIVPVSALVAVPTDPAPAEGYPLIAVGHGTVGIARGCAPSIDPFADADATHTLYDATVGYFVEAGYATVMADYYGLGTPGDNSYLVGEIEGRTILDSARAAMTMPEFAVQPGMFVAGHSQGGHAVLFAGQLAPDYAPELDLLGVAAIDPAADLEAIFTRVSDANDRGGVVSLTLMAVDAYTRAYPDVDIDTVLTARGQGALDNVIEELCVFQAIIGTQLARPVDLILPAGLDALMPYVQLNTPGVGPFATPIFIAQGDADVVVPAVTNDRITEGLCAAGNATTYRAYEGLGHFAVVDAAAPDILA